MKHIKNFRLILAVVCTCAGLFVALIAFAMFYKNLFILPYPKIRDVPKQEVTITVVGDVMLSRNVARYAQKSGSSFWMWEHIGDFLLSSDFVVGNLESPTNGTNVYSYQKTLVLNALPELIETLPQTNFSLMTLANNHALDQGKK